MLATRSSRFVLVSSSQALHVSRSTRRAGSALLDALVATGRHRIGAMEGRTRSRHLDELEALAEPIAEVIETAHDFLHTDGALRKMPSTSA
jgi:hypothetical protein